MATREQNQRASSDLPVGGQAVLEGVMMRAPTSWAVAMRAPAKAGGGIKVHTEKITSILSRRRVYRLPVLRGMIALVESLKLGSRALMVSANAQLAEGEAPMEATGATWMLTVAAGLFVSVGVFFVLPVVLADLGRDQIGNPFLFVVVEKVIRVCVLVGYIWLFSHTRAVGRLYEYHGAEHKTIACHEAGDELTPENAQQHSRFHLRCGTSFLLIVVVVAFLVFVPLGVLPLPWLIVSRIVGMPVVIGISYEVIRWAGKQRENKWVRAIMYPGLLLQRLTTREPSLAQLEVAIASLKAVEQDIVVGSSMHGLEVGA